MDTLSRGRNCKQDRWEWGTLAGPEGGRKGASVARPERETQAGRGGAGKGGLKSPWSQGILEEPHRRFLRLEESMVTLVPQ